ncbi:MAG: class I SAM-dependent methyltransferase [Gammaproteobacteria bacterium]|nr:class I SAM-dependent methyltransferase [Gammaproteobacteria bacterium]MDB3972464.1 class I SAM-dependent methyltransferase [Candidatus Thioglobus sp.]
MAIIKKYNYLKSTFAPPDVLYSLLFGKFNKGRITKPYLSEQHKFRGLLLQLNLSNDWFTNNIPFWLYAFNKYNLKEKKKLNILEIGSWEGLSSYFILHSLPNANLTCVDTWEGADEHKSGDAATKDALSKIETSFDKNLLPFKNRLTKYKSTSFSFFNDNPKEKIFDMVYIDGSHHCDDVIIDAIKSFQMLKVGGIMIFDDYLWQYYPRDIDNPAAAINVFLKLKEGSYKVVRVYYQLIIEKISDNNLLVP